MVAGIVVVALLVLGGALVLLGGRDGPAEEVTTDGGNGGITVNGGAVDPAAAQLSVRDLPGSWALETAREPGLQELVPCDALPGVPRDEHLSGFRGGRPGPVLVSAVAVYAASDAVDVRGALGRLEACDEVSRARTVDVGDDAVLAVSDHPGPPAYQDVLVLVRAGVTVGAVRLSGYPRGDEEAALELARALSARLGQATP
jgi:hypothetical protein